MKTYTIEVTDYHLRLLSNICEVMGRAKIGQFSNFIRELKDKDGKSLDSWGLKEEIECILKPLMGLDKNQSWSVCKYEDADVLFDIYEVIRHKLSWDDAVNKGKVKTRDQKERDYSTMMGVSYEQPFHWNNAVPLITILDKENDTNH